MMFMMFESSDLWGKVSDESKLRVANLGIGDQNLSHGN
jgi:hypothetical protein